MARNVEQLTKQLGLLAHLNKPLLADSMLAMERVIARNNAGIETTEDLKELTFWVKVTASNQFAHVNALGLMMRRFVTLFGTLGNLSLPKKTLAKLSEKRYDAATDRIFGKSRPLSATDSLKLGCRYYSQMLGAEFSLATGGTGWEKLVGLQVARRKFTHPERIEHLWATSAFPVLQPALTFFSGEMLRFFAAANAAVGLGLEKAVPEDLQSAVLGASAGVQTPVLFTEEELTEKVVRPGGTLKYATYFLQILSYDGTRSRELLSEVRGKNVKEASFVRRLALRTQARQLEALSHMIWFLLESARRMKRLSFTEADFDDSIAGPVGRLVARVNLWSQLVGSGRLLDLPSDHLETIQSAWKKRDNLIHPKLPKDLELSESDSEVFSNALWGLQCRVQECMTVDPEKWVAAYKRGLKAEAP